MKIVINNTRLVLIAFLTSVAILALGWTLGRSARDNASTLIINGQNQVISTYAYQVSTLQNELKEKNITLDVQKGLVWYNEKQIDDFKTVQVEILHELKALKSEIKKAGTDKPFLPDNAILLPEMILY